jgi:hypothetical protein
MAAVISTWLSLFAKGSLAAAMIVLQAFTPLLHAHLGSSQIHGWHIHLLPAPAFNSHFTPHDTAGASSLTTGESPEIDVEGGIPASQPMQPEAGDGQWTLVAVLAVLAGFVPLAMPALRHVAASAAPVARRWRPPNSPPPALAPPPHS